MQAAGADLHDGLAVDFGRIAGVDGETVAGEAGIRTGHHAVAHDLGDDGGGGDRQRPGIALDDGAALAGKPWRHVAPVCQHQLRGDLQAGDGAAHGVEAGLADIDDVDAARGAGGDGDEGALQDQREQRLALRRK